MHDIVRILSMNLNFILSNNKQCWKKIKNEQYESYIREKKNSQVHQIEDNISFIIT